MNLSKILKNRFLFAGVAIVLALVLCFVVAPAQYKDMDALTDVVKVKTEVKEGTKLTSDMLTVVKVGAYGLDSNVLTSIDEAVGLVPLHDLAPRSFIYKDELADAEAYGKGGGVENLIGKGQSLISITMANAATSVSGIPKPGDIVDVFYAHSTTEIDQFGYSTKKTKVMHPDLLKDMVIYAVMNNSLTSTVNTTSSGTNSDRVPSVITFIATPEQEALLVELEHSGDDVIHLVLKESR